MPDKIQPIRLTPPDIRQRWLDMQDDTHALLFATHPFARDPIALSVGMVDSAALDAFARQRVTTPHTLFDSKQIFDNNPLLFDDAETSGAGTTSTHSIPLAASTMSVSAATAGTRIRQQKTHNNYQPGKSQLAIFTGVLGAAEDGITRRLGLYNDDDGMFFQLKDSVLSLVIRSSASGSAVDSVTPQSAWNFDTLDGEGLSQVTIDTTKVQIFFLDYEWLGTGQVRWGIFIDGIPIIAHHSHHANTLTTVYMSSPNLPVRFEINNDGTGAAASLVQICSTVISEGGEQNAGVIRGVTRGASGFSAGNDTNLYPILSIRLKEDHLHAVVNILDYAIMTVGNSNFESMLLLNPTVAGDDQVSWVGLTNGSIEYDISRDDTNTLTGGIDLGGTLTQKSANIGHEVIQNRLRLGSLIDGTRDELVLAARVVVSGAETYFARLDIEENG
jgi:hypothetical protein